MSHNQYQFIGNLTRDPKVEATKTPLAIIDIAVNNEFRNGEGDRVSETHYFRLKAFGAAAENHGKFLSKGSKIFAQGRIVPTSFEKDGVTTYGFDFIADKIEYLSGKKPDSAGAGAGE